MHIEKKTTTDNSYNEQEENRSYNSSSREENRYKYAGFWRRTGAYLIDILAIIVIEITFFSFIMIPVIFKSSFSILAYFESIWFLVNNNEGFLSSLLILILA